MGIQINGQTDTVTATDGSINVGGDVTIPGVLTYEDVTNIDSIGIGTFRNGIDVTSGTSTFAGRVNVGASNLNNRALNAINASTAVGAVSANNHNANGILFQGYNTSVDANNASFVVRSNGSTGIGTATPSQLLHLHSDASHKILLKRGGQYPSECIFANEGNLLTISNNKNGINFDVGSSSLATAMYIEDGGNIGIGTDNPQVQLHLTAADPYIRFQDTAAPSGYSQIMGTHQGAIAFSADTSNSVADSHLRFDVDGTERMRIMSDGTVKIGTGTGNPILMLNASTSGTSVIQMGDTADNNIGQIHYVNSDDSMKFFTNNAERLRIASDGDLTLTGADNVEIKMKCGTSSGNNILAFLNSSGVTRGNLTYDSDNNFLLFNVNQSERLRITSDGKVSISSDGTVDGLLTIKGNSDEVTTPSIRLLDGSDTREVSISNTSGDFVVSVHGTDNAIHGQIKMFESGIFDISNGGASGSNTNRLRITSGGIVKINNPGMAGGTNAANALLQIKATGQYDGLVFGNTYAQGAIGTNSQGALIYTGNAAPANLGGGLKHTHIWYSGSSGGGGPSEKMSLATDGTLYLGPYDAPGAYTSVPSNIPYKIKVAPYGWQHHSEIACISMGSHHGTGQDDGQIIFQTATNVHSDTTGLVSRVRITEQGSLQNFCTNTTNIDTSNTANAGNSHEFIYCRHSSSALTNGTNAFRVTTNGNVTNTNNSYGSLSDQRLKENIVNAGSQWDDIKSIQIRKFNFRENTGHPTHTQLGLIAQEIESVSPGLVENNPVKDDETVLDANGNQLESTKSINYSVLYMKAVKALQESMARIETLEAKVAALESA